MCLPAAIDLEANMELPFAMMVTVPDEHQVPLPQGEVR